VGSDCKKRTTVEFNKLCQQLHNKKGTEMDTLVSGVKKFIKAYGKEKDTLISMELEMLLLFCMLKKI
jgi:hypothetical protein